MSPRSASSVSLGLHSTRVTNGFREALFDASNLASMTPHEFALRAAGEKLRAAGRQFPGVFRAGDTSDHR